MTLTSNTLTLRTGMKAYYDSFAGLLPVKVTRITGTSGIASTAQRVTFQVQQTRNGYKFGEVIEASGLHVIPRKAARSGKIRPYFVEVTQ